MTSPINSAIMQLVRRAEANDTETLVSTFVEAGSLLAVLESRDHQVMYGRRGTGKTHVLQYLGEQVKSRGDMVVYIDMRTIGSSGGIYADPAVPLTERGTRLLADTMAQVYNTLQREMLEASYTSDADFTAAMSNLDRLGDALTDVRVTGDHEVETRVSRTSKRVSSLNLNASLSNSPMLSASVSDSREGGEVADRRDAAKGPLQHRVHFGAVSQTVQAIVGALPGRLWVLMDEWSDIPMDLQPLLADLLRRSLMSVTGVTIKVAAIEQRSNFMFRDATSGYIGFELGPDIAADIDLDDFMVFGNDSERAGAFFRELLFRHIRVDSESRGLSLRSSESFIGAAFTQKNAFEELVRAAEGVPRDAINIIRIAAQDANDNPISVPIVRSAARRWYLRDKEKPIESNLDARSLLHWIIDEVIAGRRARAFLLRQGEGTTDPLINALYDARVLHVIKRGVATHDQPGVRFDVYALDYGCYVQLISTAKAPEGLFVADDGREPNAEGYVEVPADDYRSIRRAILSLDEFWKAQRARDAKESSLD